MIDLGIPGYEGAVEIARGSYGIVYRARHVNRGETVAIKFLYGSAGEQAGRRFERERRAMVALSGHPHVVAVHDWGFTVSGQPYLVMDYMAGGSLADRLAHGPLPWVQATEMGVKLAGALEAVHRAGVLHRDLKPANLLLSADGEPHLGDFGIARIEGSHSATAAVMATVAHAAPEILGGRPASVASDVYGLASTVFALLSGRSPFDRPGDEGLGPLVTRIATEPVPDLRPAGVPEALCRAIEGAMAKDPADRPASAAAFGQALQAAQPPAGKAVTQMVTDAPAWPGWTPDPLVGDPDGPTVAVFSTTARLPADTVRLPAGTRPAAAPASASPGRKRRHRGRVAVFLALVLLGGTAAGSTLVDHLARRSERGDEVAQPGVSSPPTTPPSTRPPPPSTRPTPSTTARTVPPTTSSPPSTVPPRPAGLEATLLRLGDLPVGWRRAPGGAESGCIGAVAASVATARAAYERPGGGSSFVPHLLSAAVAFPPGGAMGLLGPIGEAMTSACGETGRTVIGLQVDHPPDGERMGITLTIRDPRSGTTYQEIVRVVAAGDNVGFVSLTVPAATADDRALVDGLAETARRRLGGERR